VIPVIAVNLGAREREALGEGIKYSLATIEEVACPIDSELYAPSQTLKVNF
jgi:hypothetical protein